MHIEVHGGTVNITNGQSGQGYRSSSAAGQKSSDHWGRHLARIKDFING
jgi:hypothetical protein